MNGPSTRRLRPARPPPLQDDAHTVYQRLRKDWRQLRDAPPGARFQQAFEQRQRRRRGAWSPVRVLKILAGVTLAIVGPIVGMIPGPGGIIVFALGLALVATEVRPAAKAFDWFEVQLHAAWRAALRVWASLGIAHRVLLVVGVVAVCAVMVYVAFAFTISQGAFAFLASG